MINEQSEYDVPVLCPITEILTDAEEVRKLYALLGEESLYRLTLLIEGLLENSSDCLFESARKETEQIQLGAYFNTMRALKNKGDLLIDRFAELSRQNWHQTGSVALPDIIQENLFGPLGEKVF